jgi:hypothetical protein
MLVFVSISHAQDILLLKKNGKVIIGDTTQMTTPTGYNLYVQNGILTEKVKVSIKNTSEWSDDAWVRKPSIANVEKSILANKHLVNMPSADSLVANGYELKAMDARLLEQIEWLWQHLIDLEKENKSMKMEMEALKKQLKK